MEGAKETLGLKNEVEFPGSESGMGGGAPAGCRRMTSQYGKKMLILTRFL